MKYWVAPAKVNLSLRVLGKRADGFHELESLMVPLSLGDTLGVELSEAPGVSLSCSDPEIPSDDRNLVVRVARVFLEAENERGGKTPGIRVDLQKRVPSGAGLGGGSSDAGTMLLALNELLGTGFSLDRLAEMGARVGSDVPFFVYQRAAWIRGRGERVEPLAAEESVPRLRLWLVKPPFGVPTPWAYGRWKDSEEIPGVPYAPQRFSWGELVNDLERPVFEKYLLLADLKQWLMNQPEIEGALLSGSGATVFGVLGRGAGEGSLRARLLDSFGSAIWSAFCWSEPDVRVRE